MWECKHCNGLFDFTSLVDKVEHGKQCDKAPKGKPEYELIAEVYYKRHCAVCGIEDVLVAHHMDENRENNHPSNLIFLCPNDHIRAHKNMNPMVKNKNENVKKVIDEHIAAWGEVEDFNEIQLPDAPPDYFLK